MELEGFVRELVDRHGVPGVAIGFVDRDGSTQTVTVGDRGDGRGPVDHDSVFAAASLSKPVFAAGVMTLVDDGRLDLDRPLDDYLTEPYLASDERAGSITARMVLSHTTGFPNWRGDGPLFLRWSPGTRWGYSGEGYAYLQQVVERLTSARLRRIPGRRRTATARPLRLDLRVPERRRGSPRPRSQHRWEPVANVR